MKLFILSLLFIPVSLFSQDEFRLPAANKTIVFKEIDRLTVIGYSGNEMKINSKGGNREENERAAGMRKIGADGRTDNTGFGVAANEVNGEIEVTQVGKSKGELIVQVPNNAMVKVIQSTYRGSGLEVRDFDGELDVSMLYHTVKLENTYGPVAVNTVYGDIVAKYTEGAPKEEIRLHSTYQVVDLALPGNTPADVRLSTSYGSMYTDFDIVVKPNIEREDDRVDDTEMDRARELQATARRLSGQVLELRNSETSLRFEGQDSWNGKSGGGLNGTINGGGVLISLRATYKDIYLRKS